MDTPASSETLVRRKARAEVEDGPSRLGEERWLDEWRELPAYVLLGDPGAGKTTSFKTEAEAVAGHYLLATRIALGLQEALSAKDILFIDALDEAQIDANATTTLAAIARFLKASGQPRFRIACREADWRSAQAKQLLEAVTPNMPIPVLHLSPLDEDDIRDVVSASLPVDAAESFLAQARQHNLAELLSNPLLLELLIRISRGGEAWPETRAALYERACRELAAEQNPIHYQPQRLDSGRIDRLLADAGTLAALLILSGTPAITLDSSAAGPAPHQLALPDLPRELPIDNAAAAIQSKLFSIEAGRAFPRHRTIAEYLAAKALARKLAEGLPVCRVVALMCGQDGIPLEALRGLWAWLAVSLQGEARLQLLRMDPVGCILNGDAASLNQGERLAILAALASAARENPWFRSHAWVGHPYGPLATPDMEAAFREHLTEHDPSTRHQAFIHCLLDALAHAPQPMPGLIPMLSAWVEDPSAREGVRVAAYQAWRRHSPAEDQGPAIRAWLRTCAEGQMHDPDDHLLCALLRDAYPTFIQGEVFRHIKPNMRESASLDLSLFWFHRFMEKTPIALLPDLALAWESQFPVGIPAPLIFPAGEIAHALLAALLEHHGDAATTTMLYQWFGLGRTEHGGFARVRQHHRTIQTWLDARPERLRDLLAFAYASIEPDSAGHRHFWLAHERLRLASFSEDWFIWHMQLARTSSDPDFVRWVIGQVAHSVANPQPGFALPSLEEVTAWVDDLSLRHAEAPQWLQQSWTTPLRHWQGDDFRRRARHEAEQRFEREQRRQQVAPYLAALPNLPPGLLHDIARAYRSGRSGEHDAHPEARVADRLGIELTAVGPILQALDATLKRADLPSANDILALQAKGQHYKISLALLVAAERASASDNTAWRGWSRHLQETLVACWLTHGVDEPPEWFQHLTHHRPELVAPVLVRYAEAGLKGQGALHLTGLYPLSRDAAQGALARAVIPELLARFPLRANVGARKVLNDALLAGLHVLPDAVALGLIEQKVKRKSLDGAQRIAWLVAGLAYDPAGIDALAQWVGKRRSRVAMLREALIDQRILKRRNKPLATRVVQGLIALLAPMTHYTPSPIGVWVDGERASEELVQDLIQELGQDPSAEAAQALETLLAMPTLGPWRDLFEFQRQAQRALRRESCHITPTLREIAAVLGNGPPANLQDLMSVLIEHIQGWVTALRGEDSFQLRAFWSDTHAPRDERDCVDLLLDRLRDKLQGLNIELHPESLAAANKRMDLRASTQTLSGRRLCIPIEAKKDDHRELWTAWRDQLQTLYSIDPAASGCGLYVVFWFGVHAKRSPDGVKPQSAEHLQALLQERIPEADRTKIKVLVMDLSWPAHAKAASGQGADRQREFGRAAAQAGLKRRPHPGA